MYNDRLKIMLAAAMTVFSVACTPAEQADADAPEAPATESTPQAAPIALATEQGVRNARMPLPGIITAGQPSREQLDALRGAGVQHFVSLRPVSEDGAGWEEEHSASEGFNFERLPISGAGSLSRENVEAFAAILDEAEGEATVLYCASSNRVGAMLALKAFWIDGATPDEALGLGRSAGLTGLEAPVRELMGLESNRP